MTFAFSDTLLSNQIFNPGNHTLEWNADKYASGLYFVKMYSDDFVGTQKLMLIK